MVKWGAMICPQCQHWIAPPGKCCSNCGYTVGAKPLPTEVTETAPMPPMAPGATFPASPMAPNMLPTGENSMGGVELDTGQKTGLRGLKKEHLQMALVLGGVIVLLGLMALVLGFARNHPFLFVGFLLLAFFVGFPILAIILGIFGNGKAQRCYVCGNSLSNHIYRWTLDGQDRRVCANCNQALKRDNSREAMKRRKNAGL